MSEQLQKIDGAREYIEARATVRPRVAIVLGSGLGALADEVEVDVALPYGQIPAFPVAQVAGHAGRLLLGRLQGVDVVIMQGRMHYYEGHPMSRIAFPIRVLHALGAGILIVTNASGGLNPDFEPGDVMLITDHINAQGDSPLIGPNEKAIGPRFPDMTFAYDPALRQLALDVAEREGIALRQGVYIATFGPAYETPAERRSMRLMGADAVGMSTVPEVIAARHAGMRVLGFSAVTNIATGAADQPPDSHDEVLEVAQVAGKKIVRLVREVVAALPGANNQ